MRYTKRDVVRVIQPPTIGVDAPFHAARLASRFRGRAAGTGRAPYTL